MLLSPLTWLIHILTVTEWIAAIILLYHYGRLQPSPNLQLFAFGMIPHALGGMSVLLFHFYDDTQMIWLMIARWWTWLGSFSLATITLLIMWNRWSYRSALSIMSGVFIIGVGWVIWHHQDSHALLQQANGLYFIFLINLVLIGVTKREQFSWWTIGGFWFVLIFVVVTMITTSLATTWYGVPSLAHHDRLHGLSESLLSLSNAMIVFGLYRMRSQQSKPALADARC
jgi:hypothetical protein